MQKLKLLLALACITVISCANFVSAAEMTAKTTSVCVNAAELEKTLSTFEKPTSFEVIEQSVPDGLDLCQNIVKLNGRLTAIYTKGAYVLLGKVYNANGRIAVTDQALDEHRKLSAQAFQELKKLAQITLGSGEKEIILIADPECPFCNSYLERLQKIEDQLTIHYLFMPLGSHPFGQYMSYRVLCKDDGIERLKKVKTISQFLEAEKTYRDEFKLLKSMPTEKLCDEFGEAYVKARQILQKNGVDGAVPKTIFSTGKYINGRITTEMFLEKYAAEKSKTSAN